jgi:hypothetical protein
MRLRLAVRTEEIKLSTSFTATPVIEFLRDQLWRAKPGRAAGRASVMIGAGYSRNADPSAAAARPFPTWAELTDRLARDLDPLGKRETDPMRAAQEYEAMFGRARLDEAVRSLVPDNDHRPSDLHRRLLALPWADVFTTNWDTLLERSCPEVHERAYDVIATLSQIPSAAVPRIVKLHGTLPANHPFILTEEDFRTYPRRFAPFVNLVQQAMMETSMVLLGFSGDDPNFLQWSGWVRDNLGEHTPPIYLVGWLTLAPQRRRMLEERKVVPIDLSTLPDARDWPEEVRHRWAIEWFLHALEGGRPPRLMRWPDRSPERRIAAAHLGWTMPARGDSGSTDLWPRARFGASDEALVAEFRPVVAAWQAERGDYPGWWIVPHAVRKRLWSRGEHWLAGVAKRITLLPMPERLGALAETLRRLDLCLLDAAIITDLPALLESILAVVLPDGSRWAADGAEGPLDRVAREDWRVCLLASARLARTRGDRPLHEARLAGLGSVSRTGRPAPDEVTFERALWHTQFLEDDALDGVLDAWDTRGNDPVWSIRKAGLLAGAGRDAEAKAEVVTAVAHARRNRRGDVLDLPALSREGWGLILSLAWHRDLTGGPDGAARAGERDPWGRWEELAPYGCDGWSEIRNLMAEMREPPPPPTRQRVRGFEPGTSSETIHLGGGLPDAYRAGRQMLRLADTTALPSVAKNTVLLREALERAVDSCAPYDAATPLVLLLARIALSASGSDKPLHRYLTRARVATLADEDVAVLFAALMARISAARKRAEDGPANGYWMSRFKAATELLSRLVPRCSDAQAQAAFDLACDIAETGWSPSDMSAGTEIEHLFSRTIARLSSGDLPAALIRATALPFPDARRVRPGLGLSDPINGFLHRVRELKVGLAEGGPRPDPAVIRDLLSSGRSSPVARKVAVERLHVLHKVGLLAPADREGLAQLIWGDEGAAEPSLPDDLPYHPWAFLLMPERQDGQATAAFRREFLRGKQGRQIGEALWNIGVAVDQTRLDGMPLVLSEEDLAAISALASVWAALPVSDAGERDSMDRDNEARAQEGLARLLIAAHLSDEALAVVGKKVALMQMGPPRHLSGLGLAAGLVQASPDLRPAAAGWLRRGLVSANPLIVGEALHALYLWLDAARTNTNAVEPPDDLTEEVAGMLTARRPRMIERALEFAGWLFDKGPERLRAGVASRCDLALSYLVEETAYENEVLAGHSADLDAPLLRQRAMTLAGAMRRAGYGDGEGVQRWIASGASDPLFEVRRAADRLEDD